MFSFESVLCWLVLETSQVGCGLVAGKARKPPFEAAKFDDGYVAPLVELRPCPEAAAPPTAEPPEPLPPLPEIPAPGACLNCCPWVFNLLAIFIWCI